MAPLQTAFMPHRVLVQASEADAAALAQRVKHLEGRSAIDGKPTVYVRAQRACKLPATTPEQLLAALG